MVRLRAYQSILKALMILGNKLMKYGENGISTRAIKNTGLYFLKIS
jgi:hypothetical protein